MTSQNNSSTQKKAPVQTFRDKNLCLKVWAREYTHPNTGEVKTLYTLDLQRGYKKDGEWKNIHTVDGDDAGRVIYLYEDARRWMRDQKQAELINKVQLGTQVNPVAPPEQQSQPAQESGQ